MEMTPKFIEITSGQNLPPKKFEIVEVQKDKFMLKTEEPDLADSMFVGEERKLIQ
jgi:WD40 repeat protein